MTDPIAALRGQLKQLEARHASGAIVQADYERERARLERALLDHVLAHPENAGPVSKGDSKGRTADAAGAAGAPPAEAPPKPSWRMVALLSLAVLVVAGAGYSVTGSPGLITGPVPAGAEAGDPNSPHAMSGEQFAAAVEGLAQKLKEQPGDGEGWAMLARSYVQLGRFADALPAFAKSLELLGDEPRLLADYADAMAVANNRNLEGEPAKLVERALKADPDNLKALALAGTVEFNRKNYAAAVRHWERLAQVAPADSPWRDQLQRSIDEARQLAGMPPGAPVAPAAPALAAAPPAAPATPGAAQPSANAAATVVRGTVRLSPALAKQAAPEDTVFLFARAAEGPRMPLAIVRKQVKDLPFEFALDDAMAMSPAMKLSLFPKIVIDARVSKSGQAQPAPGDLEGRSPPIANNANGVVVEIGQVVKN